MCSMFLSRGGLICCTASGNRHYSLDLPQCVLEALLKCSLLNNFEVKYFCQSFAYKNILTTKEKQITVICELVNLGRQDMDGHSVCIACGTLLDLKDVFQSFVHSGQAIARRRAIYPSLHMLHTTI